MSPDRSPCRTALWPAIREQLAGRPEAAPAARLLAIVPGRAEYFTAPLEPAGPITPEEPESITLAPHAWPLAAATVDLVAGCDLARTGCAEAIVAEAGRALKAGGLLILRDRIVPGSGRHGRQARRQQAAGAYLNAAIRLRDGRHHGYFSQDQWLALLPDHGFRLTGQETITVPQTLADWLAGVDLSPADAVRLEVMLRRAPAAVVDFLEIDQTGVQLRFHWPELLLTAARHS